MWNDAIDLRDFYRDSMGQAVRRVLRSRIRTLWPDTKGMTVLGLGYATPFLGQLRTDADRVLALMPAQQGVLRWPTDGASLAALTDETDLPLTDLSVDRVLLIHSVECAEQIRPMLREAWRVLSGNGRLLAIVPNRRGLWTRFDHTPFGHGRPYSRGQLTRLMRENLFTPIQSQNALFCPPLSWRLVLKAAPAWEAVGQRWFATFGGLIMIEATKQVYAAPNGIPARRRKRAYQTASSNPSEAV
jgi:hypothetical protein